MQALYSLGAAWSTSNHLVPAPPSGGVFFQYGQAFCLAKAPAGTYKLPDNGLPMFVQAEGSVTLTNQAGVTFATPQSGQIALCLPLTSTTWAAQYFEASPETAASEVSLAYGSFTNVDQAIERLITGTFFIPLNAFRETSSGDVGNAAANGGLLASDTTPILEGAGATNAQRLNWATGNVDAVTAAITLPPDVDGTAQVEFELIVAGAGTTNGWTNASGLVTNWDGGANVTDAIADSAATAVHTASAVVAAADIPDEPLSLSVTVVPPTHATDALYLYGVRGTYTRLPVS